MSCYFTVLVFYCIFLYQISLGEQKRLVVYITLFIFSLCKHQYSRCCWLFSKSLCSTNALNITSWA